MDICYKGMGISIVSPLKTRIDPCIAPDAVMVMIPFALRKMIAIARAKQASFSDGGIYNLYLSDTESRDFIPPVAIAGPFTGAPVAVIGMEKLIVMGAKRIWVFGWCGSVNPGLKTGDVIIPDGAISEEGTSVHYPVTSKPAPDAQLIKRLEDAVNKRGLRFTKGKVWTTDAPYMETSEKVLRYMQEGVLAVEMELSALMTVAAYRSARMAALFVVSDELFDMRWKRGFSSPALKKTSVEAMKILYENITNQIMENNHDITGKS